MEMDFFWLAVGLIAASYFIGDGMKNFRNPSAKSMMDHLSEHEEKELIHEKHVHYTLGIEKKDAQALTKEYKDVPHVKINGSIYYPKKRLLEWVEEVGK
ncbi:hypothetical protein [Alkalicoccus chagannorensis]|uniref:hypothetical protein n=1 Tax=Alkalicoccus chagannorensis TaxID=427072 RepID=UPI0003F61E29|nr:hypothetical protein [Alkalicoccus chagannorensis]